MARKMRKFSAGGAQGKYDRRMADIKKDFEKDSAGKTGRALEVLTAKRAQRTADAEDDRAKRMGLDRTATRKAEYDAEKNLSRTRKFGADKPTAAAEPAKASAPAAAATPEAAKAKPQSFSEAFKAARRDLGAGKTFTYNGKSFTTNIAGEGRKPIQRAATSASTPTANTNRPTTAATAPTANTNRPTTAATAAPSLIARNASSDAQAARVAKPKDTSNTAPAPKRYETPAQAKARVAKLTGSAERRNNLAGVFGIDSVSNAKARASLLATRAAEKARNAERGKGNSPLISGTDTRAFVTYGDAAAKKSADRKAKGGKVKKENIMKYAKGGSTTSKPPQPSAADRARSKKHLDELKKLKPTAEEGKVAGSANRSEGPGYKKGGKMATKFGAAMKKKSADTKGRAMMKFAKGGSIDGCAVKGKTKTSMIKMKNGGSC